jgi:hypothetical protein
LPKIWGSVQPASDATARREDPVDLGERCRRSTPDATEAGHDVDRFVLPRQYVHVADADIGVGAAVPGDRDQPWGRVDAGARRTTQASEFERESGAAGDGE